MDKRTTRRRRRLQAADRARTTWADQDFGLSLRAKGGGRASLRWDIHPEPGLALLALPRLRAVLEQVETQLALQLRAEGDSWADVGFFLGLTGEAARRRYGPLEAAQANAAPDTPQASEGP